jgi:AAA domain
MNQNASQTKPNSLSADPETEAELVLADLMLDDRGIYADHPPADVEEQLLARQRDQQRSLKIISVAKLIAQYPTDDPIVIDGLLRLGETMNVIASPKVGKTWLAAGLAYSIAGGLSWMGMQCSSGRVLILDCELKPSTLRFRYQKVAEAMGCDTTTVDVASLRGDGRSIIELSKDLQDSVRQGEYAAIVWDALYRLLPAKTSENDNAGMMAIYNELDRIAEHTGASNIVIHHTSKGLQGEKALTDVGAGAGSIARAADTHLAIRPHELADCAVVDAVCRSFRSPQPLTIRWEFPLWLESSIEPALKKVKDTRQAKQEESDTAAKKEMLDVLADGEVVSQSELFSKLSFGHSVSKTTRVCQMLTQAKKIKRTTKRRKGTKRELVFWQLVPPVVPSD